MEKEEGREKKFVGFILERIKHDKGARAALRRADHETTEYQSWEYLARWCDLEKEGERKAFGLVASSLARRALEHDGDYGLGKALASAYSGENKRSDEQSSPARARLRRLLACKDTGELLMVLRSTLKLLESRGVQLDYTKLLRDLLFFDAYGERVKARWAQDFYGSLEEV